MFKEEGICDKRVIFELLLLYLTSLGLLGDARESFVLDFVLCRDPGVHANLN